MSRLRITGILLALLCALAAAPLVAAQPTTTVTPKVGPPGTRFLFSASEFTPREHLSFWVNRPDGHVEEAFVAGDLRANDTGDFIWSWDSPSDGPRGAWQSLTIRESSFADTTTRELYPTGMIMVHMPDGTEVGQRLSPEDQDELLQQIDGAVLRPLLDQPESCGDVEDYGVGITLVLDGATLERDVTECILDQAPEHAVLSNLLTATMLLILARRMTARPAARALTLWIVWGGITVDSFAELFLFDIGVPPVRITSSRPDLNVESVSPLIAYMQAGPETAAEPVQNVEAMSLAE